MLSSLPEKFRSHGLKADVRTLLLLRKAMQKGLIKTLGDVYNVLKGIVVKEPADIGPFTKAYYEYFLHIPITPGQTLQDAILRSETFAQWKTQFLDEADRDLTDEELVNTFLDQVHLTSYDIKEVISGKEIWDKDNPDQVDKDSVDNGSEPAERLLDKMADYSDLSLEELLERMEKVRQQQRSRHQGGSHWIGTGGISPYGHGGAAKNGIRVGGQGGGKMARKVMGDKNYFPIDRDALLNDDNVDAALASIKGVIEESAIEKLDVPQTIKSGLKRGGLFIPELSSEKSEELKVMVLIDNGGYSMAPYVRSVQKLFRKMKTRFAHDLEVYYFHNTIYDRIYTDERRSKSIPVENLLTHNKAYRIFFIGDAAMAPYELSTLSIKNLQAIAQKFKKCVWLNPEPLRYWPHTYTIQVMKELIPMFPLTPAGIERAVRAMNAKSMEV
ncbi:hypothetical protein C900_00132 [Fulvivirga imtechensis AK7]|uniref:VWA containing CoxE family protein n=1 Tax=Fulvivirga imtechensis AK7 TaxID=1237149 RepID=L8K0Q1_9BACT|nr:hypothetical protein [Fulvivirga imtechensis]ELR73052.1 hypothetical protein C900_00132 [Fulvivirga imtechensis AK7]